MDWARLNSRAVCARAAPVPLNRPRGRLLGQLERRHGCRTHVARRSARAADRPQAGGVWSVRWGNCSCVAPRRRAMRRPRARLPRPRASATPTAKSNWAVDWHKFCAAPVPRTPDPYIQPPYSKQDTLNWKPARRPRCVTGQRHRSPGGSVAISYVDYEQVLTRFRGRTHRTPQCTPTDLRALAPASIMSKSRLTGKQSSLLFDFEVRARTARPAADVSAGARARVFPRTPIHRHCRGRRPAPLPRWGLVYRSSQITPMSDEGCRHQC